MTSMYDAGYKIGRLEERIEQCLNNLHNCSNNHLRYPWPLEKQCPGCQSTLQKHVKRSHAEIPYLLFGWDYILENFTLDINMRIENAKVQRNLGAYI